MNTGNSPGLLPTAKSGIVRGQPNEKWINVDQALRKGLRGFPGKWSLPQLLADYRGHRNRKRLPKHTLKDILKWADSHKRRIGRWPTSNSGVIPDAPGETWWAVEMALSKGLRGLPGGSSLARLLVERRHVRNPRVCPMLSMARILRWADEHHRRTGMWPLPTNGPVHNQPGETWDGIDRALRRRGRGLRKSSSLARLLFTHRRVTIKHRRAEPLTINQILRWADAHKMRTGRWPKRGSEPIPGTRGETWYRIGLALHEGRRGLPAGLTVAELLVKYRGVYHVRNLPRLKPRQIKRWIKAFYERHQRFPSRNSGPIAEAPGETWGRIDSALKHGSRGLRNRSSLAKLIRRDFTQPSKL